MSIDTKSLVKVIKACKAAGVLQMKLGDLELRFAAGDAAEPQVKTGEAVQPPTEVELREAEETVRETDILDHADDELAHMQVENPALFEDLLIQRELEPRGDGKNEIALD